MTDVPDLLPTDLAVAHAMILAERAARQQAEAERAEAKAALSSNDAFIAHLKLEIEKLRRAIYGRRSEKTAQLLDQLEIQLEEAQADASEDELADEKASTSKYPNSFVLISSAQVAA